VKGEEQMEKVVERDGFPFRFYPDRCRECGGRCCRGEPGYIWVDEKEVEEIARFLNLPTGEFIREYLKRVGNRYSIKEVKRGGEYLCLFFDWESGKCQIYPVRPRQCREFPFWERFKTNLEEVIAECPGVEPL